MSTTIEIPESTSSPADDALPRIPGYAVERVLGRGGMGCVYLARDLQMGREVAIKMIVAGAEADLIARFREEVAAVAAIRHPNVLQVYHAGDVDGRPYLVMEYVSGGTLGKALGGQPVSARDAASLLEPVARAIEQCHQQGVLHRDLKPGNILLQESSVRGQEQAHAATLVDESTNQMDSVASRVPKIADFGLAKRLQEGVGLTKTGDVLGTPAYMAPEQASGVVSTLGSGVDVYALGAILYEMLTGRPPFSSPDPVQTLMMVLSMDPVPPRNLQPKLPRDIDTICLKCLEKSPKKRYASAAALADDLRRFLDGRAIAARPVRAWERAIKWAKRRPAAAGLLVVSILALAVIIAGGSIYNAQLKKSNERLEGELSRSQAMFNRGHLLAQFLLEEHTTSLGNIKGSTRANKRLIEELLPYLDHLANEIEGHDRIPGDVTVPDLARAYEKIAGIQGYPGQVNLEDREGAKATFRKALGLRRSYMAAHPDDLEAKKMCAKCLVYLGEMEALQSVEKAQPLFEEALALARSIPEGKLNPDEHEQFEHETTAALAELQLRQGKLGEASAIYRKLLARAREVHKDRPGAWRSIWNLAQTLARLAEIEDMRNDLKSAAELYEEAIPLSRELVKSRPEHVGYAHELAVNLMGYGDVYDRLKQPEKALQAYRESTAMFREVVAKDPNAISMRRKLAIILEKLGTSLSEAGQSKEALGYLEESVSIIRGLLNQAILDKTDPRPAQSSLRFALTGLGKAHGRDKNREAEQKCLIEALTWVKQEGDMVGEAGIFLFLGESFWLGTKGVSADARRQELRSALRCFNDAIALYEKADKSGLLPDYLKNNLAVARLRRSDTIKQQEALGPLPDKKP